MTGHEPHDATRRQKRGLGLIPLVILAVVAMVFIGMNLSHKSEQDESRATGNDTVVENRAVAP